VGFMGTGNCTSARSSVQRVVQGRAPHVSRPFGEVVAADLRIGRTRAVGSSAATADW